jgi:uncharacterized membrane protein
MGELKKRYKTTPKFRNLVVWLITVLVSIVLIFGLNRIITKDLTVLHAEGTYAEKAKVVKVQDTATDSYALSEDVQYENSLTYFTAKLLTGESKGEEVLAAQTSDNYTLSLDKPVKAGDKVILYNYGTKEGDADWIFGGYYTMDAMIRFGLLFCVLLLFFGHIKGLNTLISLAFTCMAVFMVYVPSILAGYNVYLMTCLTCVYVIVMTLFITSGLTEKAITTILGCSFGVAMAAILELIFSAICHLTGVIDEHSVYLGYLDSGVEIDLKSLVFGMIVIGAMGAVMDVAMDISSSLHELHYRAPHLSFKELYQSGITIGRDVMGTMANTLVLAYIGSSLCSILLLITYATSLRQLLNRENITVEILQALIGSSAILLAIPLTSLICAFLYTNRGFLKWEGKLTDPSDDYDPNAPVVRMEPQHRSIVPEDPVITLKKESPKPAKKQDVSQFSGFYYENAEDPPRKGRTSILTLRKSEEGKNEE